MLTLDTPITIEGVETTPRDYMNIQSTKHQRYSLAHRHMSFGLEAANEYWLDLFHDTIANKNIVYTLIGEDE